MNPFNDQIIHPLVFAKRVKSCMNILFQSGYSETKFVSALEGSLMFYASSHTDVGNFISCSDFTRILREEFFDANLSVKKPMDIDKVNEIAQSFTQILYSEDDLDFPIGVVENLGVIKKVVYGTKKDGLFKFVPPSIGEDYHLPDDELIKLSAKALSLAGRWLCAEFSANVYNNAFGLGFVVECFSNIFDRGMGHLLAPYCSLIGGTGCIGEFFQSLMSGGIEYDGLFMHPPPSKRFYNTIYHHIINGSFAGKRMLLCMYNWKDNVSKGIFKGLQQSEGFILQTIIPQDQIIFKKHGDFETIKGRSGWHQKTVASNFNLVVMYFDFTDSPRLTLDIVNSVFL
jgi:hypothetical protein